MKRLKKHRCENQKHTVSINHTKGSMVLCLECMRRKLVKRPYFDYFLPKLLSPHLQLLVDFDGEVKGFLLGKKKQVI